MELNDFAGAERSAACRALLSARALEHVARTTDVPDFWILTDRLSNQLRARGLDISGKSATIKVLRALLRDLAGHRPGMKLKHLPRVDRELAATLLDIAAWMRRLERPAWKVEVVRCPVCGLASRQPRTSIMGWRSMHLKKHRDRVAGILVGLAAGDEIGGPTEMALRLARSLAVKQAYDPGDVFARYLDWHGAGSFDTGPVAARVFDLAMTGMAPEGAARQVHQDLDGMTAGCNPAHRAVVLAMSPWIPAGRLVAAARQEAGLTHHHILAADTAAAMVLACRQRIMGRAWMPGLDADRFWSGLAPEVHAVVSEGRGNASRTGSSGAETTRDLSTGGYAPDALRAALHFATRARDPVAALAESRRFAGPCNYCPVLVGALLGAQFGAHAFDDGQLRQHPAHKIAAVRAVAGELAEQWTLGLGAARREDKI